MTAGTARRLLGGFELDAALVAAGRLVDNPTALGEVLEAIGVKPYESGQNLDATIYRDWRGCLTHQPQKAPDPLSTEASGEIHSPEPSTGQRVDERSTGPAPLPQGMDEPLVQTLQGRVSGVVIDVRDQPVEPIPDQAIALSREARDKAADGRLDGLARPVLFPGPRNDVERLVERVQQYRAAAEAADRQEATGGR